MPPNASIEKGFVQISDLLGTTTKSIHHYML